MPGIEESVRSFFEGILRDEARRKRINLRIFPLNSQDRDAAGDVIFSDEARLTLIEFKSYENNLRDEGRKQKREVLCELLTQDTEMRLIHDACHLAAWSASGKILLNIYRHEICHQGFFPKCRALPKKGTIASRFTVDDYAKEFFQADTVSIGLDEFERYLAWVMTKTSGSEKSTVSVQAQDLAANEFVMVNFGSLRTAHEWFAAQDPRLKPRSTTEQPRRIRKRTQ